MRSTLKVNPQLIKKPMEVVQMKNAPTISQNFRNNGGWATLTLTEQEIGRLEELHRGYTERVMQECLEDARMRFGLADCTAVAAAMFEARAEKVFTWVMRALQDKTRMVRGNGGVMIEEERVMPSSLLSQFKN
jgi:hypothetical protein